MQRTAPSHDGSARPVSSTRDKAIAQYWRVVVASDARIATCSVFQGLDGDLQLRIVYEPDDIVRIAPVHHVETARSMAEEWLMAARHSGRFETQPEQP